MAIVHSFSFGKQNKRVIFLLAGWQNKLWMFRVFAALLALNGFYCITYAYDDDVFSSDTEKTVRNILHVRDGILSKIVLLRKEGYSDFSIFGTSLGSVIALLVANVSPDISKIILNTTGYDFAETVWSWNSGNQYFKKELQSKHFTLEKLQVVWAPINPGQNIDAIHGGKFLVYLSKKDEIIPYRFGVQLVDRLKENGNECTIITNKTLGHILAGIYNLCHFPVYLRFLNT
ncbi:MAG: prolyl oligopeptidase family serine peptidase [Patescibacteria group bacterium]|nr:prolyl oligopeptidase family serine peptidase [Patescibacteria group bacterium]